MDYFHFALRVQRWTLLFNKVKWRTFAAIKKIKQTALAKSVVVPHCSKRIKFLSGNQIRTDGISLLLE